MKPSIPYIIDENSKVKTYADGTPITIEDLSDKVKNGEITEKEARELMGGIEDGITE